MNGWIKPGDSKWRNSGNGVGCFEKRFENGKVGHALRTDQVLWKAFFDGRYLGAGSTESLAMMIVDQHASEEKYA